MPQRQLISAPSKDDTSQEDLTLVLLVLNLYQALQACEQLCTCYMSRSSCVQVFQNTSWIKTDQGTAFWKDSKLKVYVGLAAKQNSKNGRNFGRTNPFRCINKRTNNTHGSGIWRHQHSQPDSQGTDSARPPWQ